MVEPLPSAWDIESHRPRGVLFTTDPLLKNWTVFGLHVEEPDFRLA